MTLCVHFTLIYYCKIDQRHKEGSLTFKLFHRDLSKWLPKKGQEGKQSGNECNIGDITPQRIRKAFNLDNPDGLSTHGSLTSSAGRLQ